MIAIENRPNEEIVVDKLQKSRDDKASGADELVSRFLSKIGNELAEQCQKIEDNESVLSDWKDVNVIPIYKGGIKSTASNYRPISLVSCANFLRQ